MKKQKTAKTITRKAYVSNGYLVLAGRGRPRNDVKSVTVSGDRLQRLLDGDSVKA